MTISESSARTPGGKARATLAGAMAVGLLSLSTAPVAAPLKEESMLLSDGRIGYVVTNRYWSLYETDNARNDCPKGFNDGPREEFKALYEDGRKRSIVDAQLQWEGVQWHPSTNAFQLPFHESQSRVSYGLDLDGETGAEDFTSPEGEPGIDNQFYRVIGCIDSYRVGGSLYTFENNFMQAYPDNRILIELSGVDDLANDDEVTVTTYRGIDKLLGGATGKDYLPGGTQRVDMRWGTRYIFSMKGRIVDGVLLTDPIDELTIPWGLTAGVVARQHLLGARFKLRLTEGTAEGLLAGYMDIATWARTFSRNLSTHHASYGRVSAPSVVAAMRRLADAHPDESGSNTAISTAVSLKMVQVYIVHPDAAQGALASRR